MDNREVEETSISNELTLKTINDAYTSEAAGTVDTSNYDAFLKSILE